MAIMDLNTLKPGQLYAWGNPPLPRCVVLIDADAWRWHSDDDTTDKRRAYVPPSGRRLRYKRVGARTGVNTGSLVLRQREPAHQSALGNDSLPLAVEPITTLRLGLNPGGTGNDTGLVGALTQGPDGGFQPWVRDLLARYGLHFDLIDPRTIASTWEDWQVQAAALEAQADKDAEEDERQVTVHAEFVAGVVARLAELGVTYSPFGNGAQVTEVDDGHVRMPYTVLAGLLARIPS
jgi:hypothetical protein